MQEDDAFFNRCDGCESAVAGLIYSDGEWLCSPCLGDYPAEDETFADWDAAMERLWDMERDDRASS
jgi:hypothetical protein